MEHELWITALFNDNLAGVGNAILGLFGQHAHNPARPWVNFMTMQILAALIVMIVFGLLRGRLSMDKPGKMQHIFETCYTFLARPGGRSSRARWREVHRVFRHAVHLYSVWQSDGRHSGFESPTMFPAVTAGCALATFLYYNIVGFRRIRAQSVISKHFVGPDARRSRR